MQINLPFFKKKVKDVNESKLINDIIEPSYDDGSSVIDAGGTFITSYSANSNSNENRLRLWQSIARTSEVSSAIQDIINDAIVYQDNGNVVSVDLEGVELSENIKNKIRDEFKHILGLLNYSTTASDLFEDWYVSSKQFFHIVISDKESDGIQKLIKINPSKIKLIKEVTRDTGDNGIEFIKSIEEYFLLENETMVGQESKIKLPRESVAYAHSGLTGVDGQTISYIDKAVKPYNQLNDLEDSKVIYNVARAPEKRIFYIDVGTLPKSKAEQYVNSVVSKFKNKMVYDSNTGTVRDGRHITSMMEDIFLPRKDGSKGTEVSSIPSGGDLGNIDDILYFRKKLYKSLHIPLSRIEQETSYNLGRTGEITRDEIKFGRFISTLRTKYSGIFRDLLRTQVVLKKIMTPDEWIEFDNQVSFNFGENSYFAELTAAEVNRERIQTAMEYKDNNMVGSYVSNEFIRKNILKQTEEEIKEQDDLIVSEKNDQRYAKPEGEF